MWKEMCVSNVWTKLEIKEKKIWKWHTSKENQNCQSKSNEDELFLMIQRQLGAQISGE